MNFDFTDEQKLFADAVRKFAAAKLEAGSLARAHDPRFSLRRRRAHEPAGSARHHHPAGRRRPGRHR